jgi:hypothetical protein
MIERFKSRPTLAALAAAAITALGVGGVAVAQSDGGSAGHAAQKQSAAEQEGSAENSATDRTEKADGNETADDDSGAEHEAQGQE